MIRFPVLETNRLWLRQLQIEEVQELCQVLGGNEAGKWNELESVNSLAQARRFIEEINAKLVNEKGIYWAVVDKSVGRLIGICGGDWNHIISCTEIRFGFRTELENPDLPLEALCKVLQYAFEEIRLQRVEAIIRRDNQAARELLTASGMIIEGVLRERKYRNGSFHDCECYSMLLEEYHS